MTNPTPHGQVPEALTHERGHAIMEGERNASLDAYSRVVLLTSAESRLYEAAFTNGWDRCAAHVQNPAEIEHVAGNVSKNGAESNMMDLIDDYAEARHVGGCHTYNAKTAEARAKVIAALRTQQPAPAGAIPSDKLAELHEGLAARLHDGPARNLHLETAAALRAQPAPATQQAHQQPCPTCAALARTVMLDQVSFDRKPDCYGIRQITDDEGVEEWEDIRTSPDVAREEANDMMATGRGELYEVVPLWTTPQPSPTPQADSQPAPVLEGERDLDAWKCERCHGKGWHWQSESVNHGKEIGVENVDLKTHCDACEGTGWCGPDADRAARAPAESVTAPAGGADWQDISTAPKDGTRFVAVGQNYGLDSEAQHTCIAQWLAGCWVEVSDWNETSELKYLTHWMPLPPLPGSAASATADSVTAPAATPTAASIAWTALRDLTDPLGEAGVKIMGHVRIYAQRQYEAGLTEGRAPPPAQAADSVLEDAARWQALPAFFDEYQIDAMKLYRDIDAYLAAARKQGANHD